MDYITIIDKDGYTFICNKNYIEGISIGDSSLCFMLSNGSDINFNFPILIDNKIIANRLHNHLLKCLMAEEHETICFNDLMELITKC